MSEPSPLSLHGATFAYGDRPVFRDLSFSLEPGRIFCLLGANGCGKSTLLRCLTGALSLRSGRVLLDGDDVRKFSAAAIARRVSVVYQEHHAPFPFTVLEVVRMGRAPHLGWLAAPSRDDTSMAERIVDQVGLAHVRHQPYTEISGGERQLALIARALCQQPRVMLLDEPTSHLDYANSVKTLRLLADLARDGLTVLMTTHAPDQPLLLGADVALMREGSFLAVGSADDVLTSENLSRTYGINIAVVSAYVPQLAHEVKTCVPY